MSRNSVTMTGEKIWLDVKSNLRPSTRSDAQTTDLTSPILQFLKYGNI